MILYLLYIPVLFLLIVTSFAAAQTMDQLEQLTNLQEASEQGFTNSNSDALEEKPVKKQNFRSLDKEKEKKNYLGGLLLFQL